jgi:hypothetical protein
LTLKKWQSSDREALLLVVDQFEELYTGCADTEQYQFAIAKLSIWQGFHPLAAIFIFLE